MVILSDSQNQNRERRNDHSELHQMGKLIDSAIRVRKSAAVFHDESNLYYDSRNEMSRSYLKKDMTAVDKGGEYKYRLKMQI